MFYDEKIGEILVVPAIGYCEYVKDIWPSREEGITLVCHKEIFVKREKEIDKSMKEVNDSFSEITV